MALRRIAKPGQTIYFRTSSTNDSLECSGILLELHPEGMVIDTDCGIEWIPAENIQVWRVPKLSSPNPHLHQEAPAIQSVMTPDGPAISPPIETTEPKSGVSQEEASPPVTAVHSSPADLELLFAGDPVLPLPTPCFNFPSLSKDIQHNINRWKNRHDYAQKVREPARMSQDVPRIAELAETLQEPSLYFLAGILADSSGVGSSRAKTYFQNALELDQSHQGATTAIASLAIRENEWARAAKFLLWAVRLEGNADTTNLVRCIGQCVLRIKNADIPPIGLLLSLELPEPARRLAASLVALVVREDSVGYSAALTGNIEQLRQTKIGNDLFPWKDDISAPVEPRITRLGIKSTTSDRDSNRKGRISAYYPGRNFGFIVDDSTGQTWFFHRTSIISPSLLGNLTEGKVRQNVTFSGSAEAKSGKYPLANDVTVLSEETAIQVDAPKRAPLRLRLQAIPKDGSSFAKAMEAEQLDQLDRAETFYREEIVKGGRHAKSAIKNLAALNNRKGKPEAAIEVLNKYQNVFEENELTSLDQMRTHFLVKARNFVAAAQLLAKLAKTTTNINKRIEYLRQEAYCLLAGGDFDGSIKKIKAILKSHPGDNASALLLAKAQDAKQTGLVPSEVAAGKDDEEYDDILSSLALGISPIARRQIDNCELRGLDARTKESRSFSSRDFLQIERMLDGLKGRRPRERADYLLTLATLHELSPESSGKHTLHELLRRHFLAVAEAAMSEHMHSDVVRCYAIESLVLCPVTLEAGRESATSVEAAWTLLLGTYLPAGIEPSTLLKPDPGQRLQKVIQLLDAEPDVWKTFLRDIEFYAHRAPAAFEHLKTSMKHHPEIGRISKSASIEGERIRRLDNAFATLPADSLSADRLRQAREALAEIISTLHFELDSVRMAEFVKILGDASDYALERHFREAETRYLRLEGDITRAIQELHCHPTHLSMERLAPALLSLRELVKADFLRVETAKPVLELQNVLDSDFYVISDGSVALRLSLASRDESAPPVEAISLVLEQGEGEPCHSPEPLHGAAIPGEGRKVSSLIGKSVKR
jgi:tetratricopeptide (TPR) repeat protein